MPSDNRIKCMSRKKRPSSRPRSRRDRDQSPESKAIKKEMNLKKKEHGGGKMP